MKEGRREPTTRDPGLQECLDAAPLLTEQLSHRLEPQEAGAVEAHLAACEACRETAAALAVLLRERSRNEVDLWPRLRSRLAAEGEERLLVLRFPSFSWRIATALATAAVTPWLVAEPVEFLALIVGLL